MDTEKRFLDATIGVQLVEGAFPDRDDRKWNIPEGKGQGKLRDHHVMGEQPSVDGWITFYNEEKVKSDKPWIYFKFPFRSVEKGGLWFAFPDNDKGKKHPVWKWQNPDEPLSNITLKPSLGVNNKDGNTTFHCHVRGGEIDWV